jgi:hypothetical protein
MTVFASPQRFITPLLQSFGKLYNRRVERRIHEAETEMHKYLLQALIEA